MNGSGCFVTWYGEASSLPELGHKGHTPTGIHVQTRALVVVQPPVADRTALAAAVRVKGGMLVSGCDGRAAVTRYVGWILATHRPECFERIHKESKTQG